MNGPNHPLTVGSRFGPYRLEKLIGRGGMGEVYQAYDTVKDRTVAIKVLPERLAEDTVYRQRFQRESHAAARLREAHVIPIHDYGEIDGRLFIDMRLVDGDSLRSLLHRHGPGSPEDAVSVVEQVAAALDAAHRDGLLHRDVKPDNILVTHGGFVYLVDFGIAQSATDESLTRDGQAVGSYRYMSPERFSSVELGPPADVYALTCVLFECLTGTRPFSASNEAQLMRAHLFDPIPRPSLVRPTVPAAFDAVVARGMAKEPGERYGTAGELAAAARAALGDRASGRHADPSAPTATGSGPRTAANPARGHTDTTETITSGVTTGTGSGEAQTPAPTASDPTGEKSGPNSRARSRGRLRQAAALLGVLIAVAASLGFAGWAYWRHTTPGTPVGDASTLRGPDVDLLSLSSSAGYHRANCVHGNPDAATVAFVLCDPNPDASAPAARFFRFKTASGMHDFYTDNFMGIFGATACSSDPAGKDGPSLKDGKEIGRKACYVDRSNGDANPGLVMTDETELALVSYIWSGANSTALRDYYAKWSIGQLLTKDRARDPDDFTSADQSLLGRLNDPYVRRNCRHTNPPVGPATAIVDCDTKVDDPGVSFVALPNTDSAKALYQADLSQFGGHACGGSGSDEVWRKQNTPIGRYFCFVSKVADPARPALVAIYEDLHLFVIVNGSPADYPGNSPKDDAALRAWFEKYFTV
ncbi:serine/threonine-protein kinase [Nocardia sp. CDC153]|uniref:serine/threonine-protein kinase n=1 Tax=Nocardia sp. CDC153 TaxID=3112167 RepID=UPI002DBBF5A8|nr:serine/threonine-protein kinase [Nocardia sp. CDC153]MEC3957088.1 serine/threonine-protein kinase [Nocardia sp. CDC153]